MIPMGIVWKSLRDGEDSKIDPRYYGYLWFRAALSLCATLPFAIAGIAVLVWNTGGLYWIVLGTLLSIIVAIYDAWVLLVEINR